MKPFVKKQNEGGEAGLSGKMIYHVWNMLSFEARGDMKVKQHREVVSYMGLVGRREADGGSAIGEALDHEWELKSRAQLVSLRERGAGKRKVN